MARNEGSCKVVLLAVACEQVIAQSQVQREPSGYFPVVLDVCAYFQIPPVADVGRQLSLRILVKRFARWSADAGVNAGIFLGGCIRRKEDGVEHLIGRTRHAEGAVLQVPPEIRSDLYVVVPMADRNHVGVGVNMLHKGLRVPGVGAKPSGTVIERPACTYLRHARNGSVDERVVVLRVPDSQFIQNTRREGMYPADLPGRLQDPLGVSESASTGGVTWPEPIGFLEIIVLSVNTIGGVGIVVETRRTLVAVEQVAQALDLGSKDGHTLQLERSQSIRHAGSQTRSRLATAGIHDGLVGRGDAQQGSKLGCKSWGGVVRAKVAGVVRGAGCYRNASRGYGSFCCRHILVQRDWIDSRQLGLEV